MKNEKGITLIALVMTVILIMILAGIGTYAGIESFSNMQVQAFVAKMIAIQEKIDVFCEQHTVEEINSMTFSTPSSDEEAVLNTVIAMGSSGDLKSWFPVDNISANYKFLNTEAIDRILGMKNFDVAIWFNPKTKNVIAIKGVEVNKVKYYRQYDLSGGQTLPEPSNDTNYTLDFSAVQTYDNKAVFKLPKQYKKVTCNLMASMSATTPTTSKTYANTDSVTVTESGIYQLVAVDNEYDQVVKTSNKTSITIVNKPMLVPGLTPVNQSGTALTTEEAKKDWYNYDSTQKKWANAKTQDGSWYVWIPRFAYKGGSTITIKFMKDISNSISTDGKVIDNTFKVAPAFQNGVTNGFQNGEWDNDITGFWVAKYEATLDSNRPRSVASTSAASTATVKNAFIYCRNMEIDNKFFNFNTTNFKKSATLLTGATADYGVFQTDTNNVDTHLMKNSEYGAVAFLTYSSYGNTGITSQASTYPGRINSSTMAANTTTSTGNETGIYGLSGGPQEVTSSGYTIDGNLNRTNTSTKYATTYYNGSAISVSGDGVIDKATGISLTENASVHNATKPSAASNMFLRGGSSSNGQLFAYGTVAAGTAAAFRPVIIVEY